MARNKPLSCQTTKHFVVIRKNKSLPIDTIKHFLNEHYRQWALIVHEHDIDPITGEVIPVHYHYVGNYIKVRTPMSTTLNEITKYFKFDNNNGIEIDQYSNLEKAIQYLIHKNNPEKTQHKLSDIMFNGWSIEELTTYMTADTTGINFDRVLALCNNYDSIIDIIRDLGFNNYHKYRNTIRDIFEECKVIKARKRIKEFDDYVDNAINNKAKSVKRL